MDPPRGGGHCQLRPPSDRRPFVGRIGLADQCPRSRSHSIIINSVDATVPASLSALVTQPTSPPEPRAYNPAGYIKAEALKDPWGQDFQYRVPGDHNPYGVDIWSLGPDGVESEDDIANWSETSDT